MEQKEEERKEEGPKEDEQIIVTNTPLGQVSLPIRSPEALRPLLTLVFCIFPAENEASTPQASTAPPRLAEDQCKGKRKRGSAVKCQQPVEDDLIKGLRK